VKITKIFLPLLSIRLLASSAPQQDKLGSVGVRKVISVRSVGWQFVECFLIVITNN